MFRFKASKYKNTAPKVPKKSEGWILDISSGSPQSCGQHIKASASFMVFNTDHRGGGSLGILPLNDHGRKHKGTLPLIHAHSDTITDFEFSPFDDGLLATGSSDTTIKLWQIPESGVAEGDSISSPIYTLTEENRRVENVVFNPAAEFILASSSFTTVKVWDLTKQQEIYVSDDLEDQCYGIDWKDDGSLIVSVCKDQQMRILDPRADKIVQQCQSHASPKDSRVVWIGDTEKILTTGCNTMRQREVTVRDIRNLNSPLTEISLDLASGALMPLFDADTNMLFLAAKGENTILFWELSNEDPYLTEASRFVSDVQSNGACLVPKRVMDVMQGEVDRILQLSSKCIVPITYQVPRRSYREYHSELFPDTKGVVPGMTCQDWLSGKNFVPQSISLDPSKRPAEGYARFSVNPKEKEASIPHRQGKATTAESKSLHNGGNKTNSDKTAKDTQNLHTQTQTDVSKPKPTVSNKPASVQGDSSGETESTPLKHSTKHDDTVSTPPNITIIPDQSSNDSNEDIIVTNVKSKQKKFQEKIDVVTEESPVLRRKDIISNKDVQRVSSFKTPTRPTSKVFQMRVSKFRHLKGVPMHQKHHIEGIRNISRSVPSESNGFDANRTRAAVPLAGPGGQIAILELSKTGKLSDAVLNRVICSAKVMDFEWDPFNDNRLFAVCDDGRMLIWNIPEGGLTESTNQPSECIMAHNDKIYIIKSHPFADNIVATASYDMSIKIWDLSDTDEPKFILDGHTDQIFGIAWSNDGQYIATVCKDKKLRVYQPLKSTLPIKETAGPPGVRGARVVWVLDGEALLVSGFDRSAGRLLYLYEFDDMTEPLTTLDVDMSPSILVPFYDEDSSTVFLTAKGEATLLSYEVAYDSPYFHQLTPVRCSVAHQALTLLPKVACNVREVEFARGFRLMPSSIEPIIFSVPRVKKEFFQNDLYPDTRVTWEVSMSGSDWLAGKKGQAQKVSLRPSDMKNWINEKDEVDKGETKFNSVSDKTSNRNSSPTSSSLSINTPSVSDKGKKELLVDAMLEKCSIEKGDLPQQSFDGVDPEEWDEN